LREFIPGYTDATLDRRVYKMERRADSIEEVFRQKDQYIENMRRIIGDDDNTNVENMITPLNIGDPYLAKKNFEIPLFFVPVNGMVTNRFNRNNKHFGVDVVAAPDVMIKATADGTVIFSDWSSEGGYVIGIQHDNNIVSVYKHNASVMCREGDFVRAGDAIAVLGGGGSTSTGPHLHFELWFKGMPLNPEDYISFEGK
jgi:murein DD-endopeptidase MepM/ murein hydrolase activator NlpD